MKGSMLRLLSLALFAASCNKTFDAGVTVHDGLPVDERNPVILLNDSAGENWMGEYAMLLASSGGPRLEGIIVTTGGRNTDLEENKKGWVAMVDAARKGGLAANIPDPRESLSSPLEKPASGNIEDTAPERSNGATLIIEKANSLSLPYRPLVVVAASRLTDVASAYLMDPTITERIWVVASVGNLTSTGASMDRPNGEMDPWASTIVATRMRYIQVSARYDSRLDVPEERMRGELPRNNAFSDWIWYKVDQDKIWEITDSSDQVSIAAVGIPGFAKTFERVAPDMAASASSTAGPPLQYAEDGRVLLVTEIDHNAAINRFWQMIKDPKTFRPNSDASTGTK
jgi:hypothetical protein